MDSKVDGKLPHTFILVWKDSQPTVDAMNQVIQQGGVALYPASRNGQDLVEDDKVIPVFTADMSGLVVQDPDVLATARDIEIALGSAMRAVSPGARILIPVAGLWREGSDFESRQFTYAVFCFLVRRVQSRAIAVEGGCTWADPRRRLAQAKSDVDRQTLLPGWDEDYFEAPTLARARRMWRIGIQEEMQPAAVR